MVSKKLLGIAVAGAFSLGGCGLLDLADAIEDAALDAAAQVQKTVTVQNVKGSMDGIGAAMMGLSALQEFGGGPDGAPGLLAQAAESQDCSGGGTMSMEESDDGNTFTITADNCTQEEEDGSFFANGSLSLQISGDPESGNYTISYTADLQVRMMDAAGSERGSVDFDGLSMDMSIEADQTAGKFSYTYKVNGSQTMTENGETNSLSYSNFTMAFSTEGEMTSASYSIDGGLSFSLADAACTDGAFEFSTSTPLAISEDADCPTAGVITVNGVTYTFEGDSITAASGDQSETFTCGEVVGDDMCELGDDDHDDNSNDDYNDDNTSPTDGTTTTM